VTIPGFSAYAALVVQAPAAPAAETNLLLISVFAFTAVFTVLAVLASIMKALTLLFPPPADGSDATLFGAISAAAAAAWPGMRVTRIEEKR
jgi:hypothetical protein